jgi:hypothetical protein
VPGDNEVLSIRHLRKALIVMCNLMTASNSLLTFIILTLGFNAVGQEPTNDTVFLLKETGHGISHKIFIYSSKTSKYYDQISNFDFGLYDQETYDNYSLKYLREKQIRLSGNQINELPLKWVILKYHKGHFYTYYPSDFYNHYKVAITDSAFIDYTGEGPLANKIISYTKIDEKTFSFHLTGVEKQNRHLTINVIDAFRGIAVFSETSSDNTKRYTLMVDADKIKLLPIIVNDCEEKRLEFNFKEPNYQKLLGQK